VMLGDGECQEGQVWEAAHVAVRYGLNNLTAILDFNGLQQYGWAGETISNRLPPWPDAGAIASIWQAFRWHTIEIDGHDFTQILQACREAQSHKGGPTIIIARTQKGQGVSFMKGAYEWHAKVPTPEEVKRALTELGEDLAPFGTREVR
jgi:transketolase